MGLKLNREELAWAAGFFDGEGSIGFYPPHVIQLGISQNHPFVLRRFRTAVMNLGKVYGPRRSKPPYRFTTAHFASVQAIVAMLWKYLSPIKRRQAAIALRRCLKRRRQFQVGRNQWA